MADYTKSALTADLEAALAILDPQIRGLNDLSHTSISPALLVEVEAQITARVHRHDLIQAVLDSLDAVDERLSALDADGYPVLPAAPVMGSLFSELQEEKSDLAAAIAVFATEQISAGPLTQTANPNPPTATGP
jgi:hypothetical protein